MKNQILGCIVTIVIIISVISCKSSNPRYPVSRVPTISDTTFMPYICIVAAQLYEKNRKIEALYNSNKNTLMNIKLITRLLDIRYGLQGQKDCYEEAIYDYKRSWDSADLYATSHRYYHDWIEGITYGG